MFERRLRDPTRTTLGQRYQRPQGFHYALFAPKVVPELLIEKHRVLEIAANLLGRIAREKSTSGISASDSAEGTIESSRFRALRLCCDCAVYSAHCLKTRTAQRPLPSLAVAFCAPRSWASVFEPSASLKQNRNVGAVLGSIEVPLF